MRMHFSWVALCCVTIRRDIIFIFLRAFCYGCWETGLLTSWIIPSFILRYRIYHRKRYYRNRASKHRDGTHRAAWKTHPRGIGPTFFSHLSHVSFTSSSISLRSSLDFDLGEGGDESLRRKRVVFELAFFLNSSFKLFAKTTWHFEATDLNWEIKR